MIFKPERSVSSRISLISLTLFVFTSSTTLSIIASLYEVTCKDQTYFAYNEKEMDEIKAEIGDQKYTVQRSKGLGENEAEMMALTTMNPKTRRLIKVTPDDAQKTSEMFDLLLGDNLDGRKEYISDYGHLYLDAADVS